MAYLKLENLSKNFGRLLAVGDINLEIKEGTFCVLLGPSGCGKSTLLNMIAGLEEPTTGKIYLDGKNITDMPAHKRDMAMVFQSYALYPHLSVFENIAFGLRLRGISEPRIKEEVQRVSQILNIEDKLDSFPAQLSGGQKQRVATGRAIIRKPKLFLFDEPLSNLDARLRLELRTEFIKLHQQLKRTTLYVTHDQNEALALGEVVVVLKDGRIQQVSSANELYDNPGNLFVAEFIGSPPMNIIPVSLVRKDNALYLSKGKFSLKIPAQYAQKLGKFVNKQIYFCFRPSAASLVVNSDLSAKVIFWQTTGEDQIAYLKLDEGIEISIKIQERIAKKENDKIFLSINWNKVYFFAEYGSRIYI